ncbi:MAG: hypothetical protein ACM3NO_06780 [Deltaproteobacteria bacterium]
MSKTLELTARLILFARKVFNFILALVFLILAGASALVTYQEWRIYKLMPADGPIKVYVVAGFTFLLIILGLYSFAKARSVR